MANVLTIIEAIQSLRSAGLSCREIARRLGIDRGTVSRRLRVTGEPTSKPANAPIFPAGTEPALAGFEPPTGLSGPSVAGAAPPIGLPAGRTKPDWFDPDLNPTFAEFCRHYGTTPLPTKPRTPRHKGKVERGIGYMKGNGLKGRSFRRTERTAAEVGARHGRQTDSRHDQATRAHTLQRGGTGGPPAAPGVTVRELSRGQAQGQPRRPRRGRQGLLLGAAGVPRPRGLGPLERSHRAGVQRSDAADRDPRQA